MIPLRDTIPSSRFPFVNLTLIALNVAAFLFELSLGDDLDRFVRVFGLVPAHFHATGDPVPIFASMFLHAGWVHLIGNLLYLYIFGDNVEDLLGHLRYLVFYLLSGLVAALAQLFLFAASTVPMLGASGAIAGVLGAYFVFFPRARVITLVPIFVFFQVVEIPAVLLLLFWFVLQLFSGVSSLAATGATGGGVAWWAHIGGFLAGMLLAPLLRPRRRRMIVRLR